jgi:hypothetical protein
VSAQVKTGWVYPGYQVLARRDNEVRIIGTFDCADRLEALELAAKELDYADFAEMQAASRGNLEFATKHLHPGDPDPIWPVGETRPAIQQMRMRGRRSLRAAGRDEVPLSTRNKF